MKQTPVLSEGAALEPFVPTNQTSVSIFFQNTLARVEAKSRCWTSPTNLVAEAGVAPASFGCRPSILTSGRPSRPSRIGGEPVARRRGGSAVCEAEAVGGLGAAVSEGPCYFSKAA